MIWLLIAGVSSVVLLMLVSPFMFKKEPALSDGLGAFAGQLDELERDRELGLISDEAAKAARLEINRRLLSAAAVSDAEIGPNWRLRQLSIGVIALSVLAAVALYIEIGSPRLSVAPAIIAEPSQMPEELREVVDQVERLAAELDANPDNPQGWAILGQSYMALGRYRDSVRAFESAIDHVNDSAFLYASLGQAKLLAEQGIVTPAVREAFARALDIDPQDRRSKFFMAEARYQAGETDAAIAEWQALLLDDNEDYRAMIERRLQVALEQGNSGD
jgi:cytochrome c-type biogenesis protein CcmH